MIGPVSGGNLYLKADDQIKPKPKFEAEDSTRRDTVKIRLETPYF